MTRRDGTYVERWLDARKQASEAAHQTVLACARVEESPVCVRLSKVGGREEEKLEA